MPISKFSRPFINPRRFFRFLLRAYSTIVPSKRAAKKAGRSKQPEGSEVIQSPLLALPPELRNMIWAYAVIPNEGHILADIWAFRTQPISALSPTFIPAICRANRQIQSEAFPLFLPLAKFHITSCGRIPFTKWLESFPDYEGFAAVRHLNFSYIFNGFWKSQLSLMLQCAGLRTVELTIPLELCLLPSRPAGSTFPNQGENLIGEKQLGGLLECENLELVVLECFAIYPSDPQIRAMLKGRAIATAEWLEEGFRRRRMKTFVCRTVTVKMHYDGAYHTAGIGS